MMPARNLPACEPYGPRGIIGSQGALCSWKAMPLRVKHGRCPEFIGAERDEGGNPITTFEHLRE